MGPQIEALTDDELLSLPNGHPLLGKLTSEEARRRTVLQTGKPLGDPGSRTDSNILGLNREWFGQKLSGLTDSLDPTWQRPAAKLAGDVVASIIEGFSAPESIVTAGGASAMRGVDRATEAAKVVPRAVKKGASIAADVSPDLIGIASPRLGNSARLVQRIREVLGKAKPSTPPAGLRKAGPAPTLDETLIGAMNEIRQPAAPMSVALPETGAVQAERTTARMLAEREAARKSAHAAQPASPAATPPAATPPSPARSTPAPAAGIRLTAEESQALRELVAQGYDEADVVREIAKQRAASAPAPPSPRPTLAAAETKEYGRLIRAGKSEQEAMDLILAQRKMTSRMGLPTSEQARRSVSERNATGRWRDE